MPNVSILSVLRERADLTPDDIAFTFTEYDQDPDGVAESLTWSQVYRRTLNVALEVGRHGSPGDRALIVAPQGLSYIVAFLGAMQAGFIAVPLSVPVPGSHDERVSAVVTDTSPTVVLTTSAVFEIAAQQVDDGAAVIAVIAVDTLDLDADPPVSPEIPDSPDIAYLQYTSGSTRLPAGVMISHRNLHANFEQVMADTDGPPRRRAAAGRPSGLMAAVLPRHGPDARNRRAHLHRTRRGSDEPDRVRHPPGAVGTRDGPAMCGHGRPHPTSRSTSPHGAPQTPNWRVLTSAG